jgi:hypothetical protein
MATLNFHVRHEVNPERMWEVLNAIVEGLDYEHVTQFDRQLSRLRMLKLITAKGNIEPTEDGREFHRIGVKRQDLVWELFHYLHYTTWNMSCPTDNTMFFTYRDYCDLLYDKRNADLNKSRDEFAAEMTSRITSSNHFTDELAKLAKGAVSLSVNSLTGVERFLEKLSPQVLLDSQFSLRHYCPPELLLLALGYITQVTEAQLEVDQPLTEDRRELLCRLCLIDDSVLDQTLDWTYPEYPDFIQPGTRTGSYYARHIRVLKLPSLKELLT